MTFAKAGAAVAITARSKDALEETKALILKEVPDAKVETYVVDVSSATEMEAAVTSAVAAFGSLNMVIANAGSSTTFNTRTIYSPLTTNKYQNTDRSLRVAMDQCEADRWWRVFETNLLGVYCTFRPTAKYLREARGYFIAVSSDGAQLRMPGSSDYQMSNHAQSAVNHSNDHWIQTSKHDAVNRLIEFIALGKSL